MQAIFAHDHRFVVRDEVFSAVYPYDTWRRYLEQFDELTVVGRRAEAGSAPDTLSISSGPNVRFHLGPGMSATTALMRIGSEVNELSRLIAKQDAVIARLPSEYGLAAIRAAQRLRKPYLIELVGCAIDAYWNYGGAKAKLYMPIVAARVRRAVAAADFVSYVTHDFLQSRYPAKPGAVTAAISNVEIPDPSESVLTAKLQRISGGGPVTFGLIGSLKTRYKGLQTALRAMGGLDRRAFDFQFRILGGGDIDKYRRIAERHGVGDRVFFDGTLPGGPAVWSWLDRVDVYLQPSLQEGLPRALIEAMSRACPAIASSAGGIPELLEAACMFPAGRPAAMADLIQEKAFDPAWREAQAARNFDVAGRYAKRVLDRERREFLRAFVHEAR